MQLRCTFCQTMFALSREEMLAALEHMEENKLIYYEAHCPNCRRGNRVERARMERFFPDWKNALKAMSKESAKIEAVIEKPAAPAANSPAAATPKAAARHGKKHNPKAKTAGAAGLKPAAKTSTPKAKPAATRKK
jgi:hypothetical protein